jgi:hypothetical protein
MVNPVLFTNIALMHFHREHDFDCRRLCQYGILVWHLNLITHLLVKSIREQNSPVSDALQITSVRSCTQDSHFTQLHRLLHKPVTKRRIKCNENKTREDVMSPKRAIKSYHDYSSRNLLMCACIRKVITSNLCSNMDHIDRSFSRRIGVRGSVVGKVLCYKP